MTVKTWSEELGIEVKEFAKLSILMLYIVTDESLPSLPSKLLHIIKLMEDGTITAEGAAFMCYGISHFFPVVENLTEEL